MQCSFDVILTRHPGDGLELALRAGSKTPRDERPGWLAKLNGTGDSPLILVASGNRAAALPRLRTAVRPTPLPELTRNVPRRASGISWEGRSFRVLLAGANGEEEVSRAEYLDRLRDTLTDYERVTLVVEYRRLERDLPPLRPGDRVLCFWEVKDHLDESHLEWISYLAERVELERPDFHGLRFYSRSASEPERSLKLQHEISQSIGMDVSELIRL